MNNIRPMSITGLVIFFMGLITLNPEIYLSGFMVLLVSVSMQMKQFEIQRQEDSGMPVHVPVTVPLTLNQTPIEFSSW